MTTSMVRTTCSTAIAAVCRCFFTAAVPKQAFADAAADSAPLEPLALRIAEDAPHPLV
jgi:hypothetical protein